MSGWADVILQPSTPQDVYRRGLAQLPPDTQAMVLASWQLEQANPKAAKQMLIRNPQVVVARQHLAGLVLRKRDRYALKTRV